MRKKRVPWRSRAGPTRAELSGKMAKLLLILGVLYLQHMEN